VVAGIVELTVVVLGSEVISGGFGDSKEVLHVDIVGNVGVEVVLEVLEHVHVFVHEVVSADSGEGEGLVHQFPGVHLKARSLTGGLLHGLGNVNNVGPVSGVESPGEHVNLVVELILSLIEILARLLELDEAVLLRVVRLGLLHGEEEGLLVGELGKGSLLSGLSGGDDSEKECGNGIFHL